MTDVNNLTQEAKKNRFSSIGQSLSDDDVANIWDGVSAYVEKQMQNQKGVTVPGLGTFTFSQKKLDVGNGKFLVMQRPIFQLSEKFAQTLGITSAKQYTGGQIPVTTLNFSALTLESPFDRDLIEMCVKEVLNALARTVAAKKNVEFTFNGIGKLLIRNGRVKMRFFKEFINSVDQSGKLVDALQNRPGTVDSVMSDRGPSRAISRNTIQLPRLSLDVDAKSPRLAMPTIQEDQPAFDITKDALLNDALDKSSPRTASAFNEAEELEDMGLPGNIFLDKPLDTDVPMDTKKLSPLPPPSRGGSRMAAPLARASAIQYGDEFLVDTTPKSAPLGQRPRYSPGPLDAIPDIRKMEECKTDNWVTPCSSSVCSIDSPKSGSKPQSPFHAATAQKMGSPAPPFESDVLRPRSKPEFTKLSSQRAESVCGHSDAGQELCYLCHQRERLNIPVSFTAERKQRDAEEDRLLQQYQHLKDCEAILKEQESTMAQRHENQKTAAFNLGVSEAIKQKQSMKPKEFHKAYIFQTRPLTPPRFIKYQQLADGLGKQVNHKTDKEMKRKADEQFIERLEQVQLAEDLAAQREQYIAQKRNATEQYKKSLAAQIRLKHHYTINGLPPLDEARSLRFKPIPIPAREPDSSEPIFGKDDMTNDKLLEKKLRARQLFSDQQEIVAQRKRNAIIKQMNEQQDEETTINRAKAELLEDRAKRYERMYAQRKRLEDNWMKAAEEKKQRELEEKLRSMEGGILVHEQCDKYKRCAQCKRKPTNCGETNLWMESKYVPGSRIMV